MACLFVAINRSSSTHGDNCGQICSLGFTSKQDGRYYPILRKHVDCPVIMRRMARRPAALSTPPSRFPPPNTISSFTQNGQCPLTRVWYVDDSKSASSNRPLYFSASTFGKLMTADRSGKYIGSYGDPNNSLKTTLGRYRQQIQNGHVAVVGTGRPWAEAMLLNLGASRITTLEYRKLVIEHKSVVAVTPSRFAKNFLEATYISKIVRCICNLICLACFTQEHKILSNGNSIRNTVINRFWAIDNVRKHWAN